MEHRIVGTHHYTFLTHTSSWSVRTFLKQDGVSNDPETFSYVMKIYERVCAHEIQSNSLSLLRLFITKFSIEKTPRTSDKGVFLGSPQNIWTCSFKNTDAHDGPGRTWNYSVCVLGYDSVLSKHIQMLNPGLLDFLHLNIPSYLAFALISWEESYEMKWLYHT